MQGPSGPALPPTPVAKEEESAPSIDLFKSIFASDEELESSDDEADTSIPHNIQPSQPPPSEPRSGAHEFRSRVVIDASRVRVDDTENNEFASPPLQPSDEQGKAAPAADLSVHQLFKHLFNTGLDSGKLCFSCSLSNAALFF